MTILALSCMRLGFITDDRKRIAAKKKVEKRISHTEEVLSRNSEENATELDKLKVLRKMLPSMVPRENTREGLYVDIANINQGLSKVKEIEPDDFNRPSAKGFDLISSVLGMSLSAKSSKFAADNLQNEKAKFAEATKGTGGILKFFIGFIKTVIIVEILPELRNNPIDYKRGKEALELLKKEQERLSRLEERYYKRKSRSFFRTHRLLNFQMAMAHKVTIGLSRIIIAHRAIDKIEDDSARYEALQFVLSAFLNSLNSTESRAKSLNEFGDKHYNSFSDRIESRFELIEDLIEMFDQRRISILNLEHIVLLVENYIATLNDPTIVLNCRLLKFHALQILREHKHGHDFLCEALVDAITAITETPSKALESYESHMAAIRSTLTELIATSITLGDKSSSFFFISVLLRLGFVFDSGAEIELDLELIGYSRNQLFDALVSEVNSQGAEIVKEKLDEFDRAANSLSKEIGNIGIFESHSLDCIQFEEFSENVDDGISAAVFWQVSRYHVTVAVFRYGYGEKSGKITYASGESTFSPMGVSRLRADRLRSENGFNISLQNFRKSLQDSQYRGELSAISKFEDCLQQDFLDYLLNFVDNCIVASGIREGSVVKFINGTGIEHHFPKYSEYIYSDNGNGASALFEKWNIVEGTQLVPAVRHSATQTNGLMVLAAELSHETLMTVEKFCDVHNCNLLLGADATVVKVLEEMASCQFIGIIAHATSGSGKSATPKISLFDGELDVANLANNHFDPSQSILLACCESGLSSLSSTFNVLSNLPKLLLGRGAGLVISTNWPIYTNLVSGLLRHLSYANIYNHVELRDQVRQFQLDLKSGRTDISDVDFSELFALHTAGDKSDIPSDNGSKNDYNLILDGKSKLNWAAFSTYQN